MRVRLCVCVSVWVRVCVCVHTSFRFFAKIEKSERLRISRGPRLRVLEVKILKKKNSVSPNPRAAALGGALVVGS